MATRSKISLTKELRMLMARLEIPVSGWTCLRTGGALENLLNGTDKLQSREKSRSKDKLTLVDVRGVGLLPGLGALLLLSRGRRGLLAGLLLLGRCLSSRGLAAGGGSLLGLGRHIWIWWLKWVWRWCWA